MSTRRIVINRDIPLMLAISAYLLLLSFNSSIGRIEGITLCSGILAYSWFNYKVAVRVDRTSPIVRPRICVCRQRQPVGGISAGASA